MGDVRALVLGLLLILAACGPSVEVVKLGDELKEDVHIEAPDTLNISVEDTFSDTQFSQWQLIVYNVSSMLSHEFWVVNARGNQRVRQRADLARIDYDKPQSLAAGEFVDVAYFNTKEKRSSGFCRSSGVLCKSSERKQLNYNQFYVVTPRDWVLKFANQVPVDYFESAQIIDDRFTDRFVFENPRVKTTLFIDTHTKLPVRVVEEGDGAKEQYDYTHILRGTVTAKDVFH